MEKIYDYYLAGPFFNDDQLKCMYNIEEMCEYYEKNVFSPRKDAGTLPHNATKKDMLNVFNKDLEAIDSCKALLANVSYKDTGTSVEIGYALAKNIPVILYRDDEFNEPGGHINLMIALACEGKVLQSRHELMEYLQDGIIPDNDFKFKVD